MIEPDDKEMLPLNHAYANAVIYGIGIIKIVNTPRGPEMSVVGHEEYGDLGKHLIWVDKNKVVPTERPEQS